MAFPNAEAMKSRDKFESYQSLGRQKDALFNELATQLETVTIQRDTEKQEHERLITVLQADLESEKESRRTWQEKSSTFADRLAGLNQGNFVLVLIDADADVYLFREHFLCQGLAGGQAAANKFMAKVREYLCSLGSAMKDAETVPIAIKAYANLTGLAQACIRDNKIDTINEMSLFWIGFSRQYPMVDFVDVGSGKEEADNKLREVLNFNIASPQCQHIMLACCHDAGYVPVLRQYAAQKSSSDRITLLSSGNISSDMMTLGFQTTTLFSPVFNSKAGKSSSRSPSDPPRGRHRPQSSISEISQKVGSLTAGGSTSTSTNIPERLVPNVGRLQPIIRNAAGKRIDKPLTCDKALIKSMRSRGLCFVHYLRADCVVKDCKRNHAYARPLKDTEYDALWAAAREGMCGRLRAARGGGCNNEWCIYGHMST